MLSFSGVTFLFCFLLPLSASFFVSVPFYDSLEMSLFPSIFVPLPFFLCTESTS